MSDPLQVAAQLQVAAAAEGFDWPQDAGLNPELWAKLHEEIAELRAAPELAERAEELGDLLFMVVNLARHLHLDPSAALSAASRKFERRFGFIQQHAAQLPALGAPDRLAAMEALWQAAKQAESRGDLR